MPQFEAYHGKTGQHHQNRFDALAPNGWHMISLSVHGDPGDPRYSAVWVKEPSPSFVAVHGLPIGQYQGWFNTQTAARAISPCWSAPPAVAATPLWPRCSRRASRAAVVAKHGLTSGCGSAIRAPSSTGARRCATTDWCCAPAPSTDPLRSAFTSPSGTKSTTRTGATAWRRPPPTTRPGSTPSAKCRCARASLRCPITRSTSRPSATTPSASGRRATT